MDRGGGGDDRGLGAVIGLLRGALIVVLLTLAAGLTTFPKAPIWNDALCTPLLESLALHSRLLLPDSLAKRINYERVKPQQTVIFCTSFCPNKRMI